MMYLLTFDPSSSQRVQDQKVGHGEHVLLHIWSKYCPILMKFELKPDKCYTKLMYLSIFDSSSSQRVQNSKVGYGKYVLLHMRSKYCSILMKFELKPDKCSTKLMYLSTFDPSNSQRVPGPKVVYWGHVLLHLRSKNGPILMKIELKPKK